MVLEVDWQRRILKRIRQEGGWGHKWATSYTVGVADLVVTSPHWQGTALIECKLEKNWHKNTQRTIAYKPKQKEEAHGNIAAGGMAFGIVVVHNGPSDVKICPTRMPGPREKFRATLQDMLRTSYDWRTKLATCNGTQSPVTEELSSFLSVAYHSYIKPTYQIGDQYD